MTFDDRIDPEYRAALHALRTQIPAAFRDPDPAVRRRAAEDLPPLGPSELEGVGWYDRAVPGLPGEPDVSVRVYRPAGSSDHAPGVLFIHGGGMWAGSIEGEHFKAAQLCAEHGAVVVSVGYRLAPEHPYPAAIRDSFAALTWTAAHASDLGFDPERLTVIGGSAGGGLALGLALMVRDRSGPALCQVMALYPMIDDRNTTPSALEFADLGGLWDHAMNEEGWRWYLGGQPADAYAAPTRAEHLSGLPPIFIDVGELDVFRDENIVFAARLMQSGVPVELHVYPGAFHACENIAPQAALSRRILQTRSDFLRRALAAASVR